MKGLIKNEEKTNDNFFIPKRIFPLPYNRNKKTLNPEDEILRKDVKSIEYIRNIMNFISPTTEKHILNGNNFSKKWFTTGPHFICLYFSNLIISRKNSQ